VPHDDLNYRRPVPKPLAYACMPLRPARGRGRMLAVAGDLGSSPACFFQLKFEHGFDAMLCVMQDSAT